MSWLQLKGEIDKKDVFLIVFLLLDIWGIIATSSDESAWFANYIFIFVFFLLLVFAYRRYSERDTNPNFSQAIEDIAFLEKRVPNNTDSASIYVLEDAINNCKQLINLCEKNRLLALNSERPDMSYEFSKKKERYEGILHSFSIALHNEKEKSKYAWERRYK